MYTNSRVAVKLSLAHKIARGEKITIEQKIAQADNFARRNFCTD